MTFGVTGVVILGVVGALVLGVAAGLDGALVTILVFIALSGALAIAVARKARTGLVAPARCASCGGLISPNAPYCKHCGASTQG
jgi:hypothetical protein